MFKVFFLFLSTKSRALYISDFLARLVSASFILASRFIFVNLLSSWVLIKWLVSGILFSISVILVLKSVFLTIPLVLGVFLARSSIFSSRLWLLESYCVLETNTLVLDILGKLDLWPIHHTQFFLTTFNSISIYFPF